MLFSHYFQSLDLNMRKLWKFENPRRRPLVTSLCCCGCHGNQLGATWLYLNGSILDTYYTYQVSCQLVEWFWNWGGGVRLTTPPLCLRVTFFSSCILGYKYFNYKRTIVLKNITREQTTHKTLESCVQSRVFHSDVPVLVASSSLSVLKEYFGMIKWPKQNIP